MTSWIASHALLILTLWPVISAVCSLAYTQLDKFPKVHFVFRVVAALGLDLPHALQMAKNFVAACAPPAPPAPPSESADTKSHVTEIR